LFSTFRANQFPIFIATDSRAESERVSSSSSPSSIKVFMLSLCCMLGIDTAENGAMGEQGM
jgi:hypothetical protein